MKKRIWKRLLVFILAVTMVAGVFPGTGLSAEAAAEVGTGEGTEGNPYIIKMKNGASPSIKDVTTFLRSAGNFSYDAGSLASTKNWTVLSATNYSKEITSSNYNSSDSLNFVNAVYKAEDKESYGMTWTNKTIYLWAKTYYQYNISIEDTSGLSDVEVNDIVITSSNGTDIEYVDSDTIDVYYDQYALNIKVPIVERMAVSASVAGTPISINQSTGQGTISLTSSTVSGDLVISYTPISYKKVFLASNVDDITYSFYDINATEEDDVLEFAKDENGNDLSYFEAETGTEVSITAIVPDGYEFAHWWMVGSDGSKTIVSNAGENTIEIPVGAKDVSYEAVLAPSDKVFVAENITKGLLYTEYELPRAFEQASSGDKIVLMADATLSESIKILPNVTFILPYSSDTSTWTISESTDTNHPYANIKHEICDSIEHPYSSPGDANTNVTLSVADNVSITVENGGVLSTGGVVLSMNSGLSGHTGGAHSDIEMADTAKIVVNGVLSSVGYITGGKVIANSGATVYQPFIINDYRGGSYTVATAQNQDDVPVLPFNEYTMQNIQSNLSVYYGAKLCGYCDLFTDTNSIADAAHNRTTTTIVGTSDGLIRLKEGACATITVHPDQVVSAAVAGNRDVVACSDVTITGGAIFADGTLALKVSGVDANINTGQFNFSVPYNYRYTLTNGIYDVNSRFKILPGAEIVIKEDATVNINKNGGVVIYDMLADNSYAGLTYPYGTQLINAGLPEVGTVYINGTLNVTGLLAGKVQTSHEDGNEPKIVINSGATLTTKAHEGIMYGHGYSISFIGVELKKVSAAESNKEIYDLTAQYWDGEAWQDMTNVNDSGETYVNTYYYVNSEETGSPISSVLHQSATLQETSVSTVPTNYAQPVERTGTWIDPKIIFECDCETKHSLIVEPGGDISAPENCVENKDGYDLKWNTNKDGTGDTYFEGDFTNMPSAVVTLYPVSTPNPYKVTLKTSGGVPLTLSSPWVYDEENAAYTTTYTVADEEKTLTLPKPVTEGYTFNGWKDASVSNASAEMDVVITKSSMVTPTYIADWTLNSYLIYLHPGSNDYVDGWELNDTAIYSIGPVDYGVSIDELGISGFSREGYTLEWIAKDADGNPLGDITHVPDQELHLHAEWTPINYIITFDSNGGSDVAPITQGYETEVTKPADPTRTGYEFKGWFTGLGTNNEVQYFANTDKMLMPMNGITLTAKWEAIDYTITFDSNGGSAVPAITQGYETEVSRPADPTRTGYKFEGWYANIGSASETKYFTTDSMPMPLGGLELSAKWTANQYEVTLDAGEGTVNSNKIQNITVTYDATYGAYAGNVDEKLPEATREGYTFAGWYTEETGGTQITSLDTVKITENQTLYAQWLVNSYAITFKDGEETLGTQQVAYGTVLDNNVTVDSAIEVPSVTGYSFVGWFDAKEGGNQYLNAGCSETMTTAGLTLHVQRAANQYTVTLDAGEGTVSENETQNITVTYDATYGAYIGNVDEKLPEATREGYTFNGWYTQETGGTQIISTDTVKITEKQTLYAQWTVNSYAITFKDGEETLGTQQVAYGTTLDNNVTVDSAIEIPSVTGYSFTGWFDAQEGGNQYLNADCSETMTTEGLTLYVQRAANQYTVTLDAGEGTVNSDKTQDITVTYDATYGTYEGSVDEKLPEATREGYAFAGWYTGANGTGSKVENGTTVAITANQTLYAHWTANSYEVTLDAGKGLVSGNKTQDITVTYDATYGAYAGNADGKLPEATREGYTFAGWYTEADGTGSKVEDGTTVAITANQTLYAHWTTNSYEVTLDAGKGLVSGNKTQDITVTYDATYGAYVGNVDGKLPAAIREGYTFAGWYTEADGTGSKIEDGTTVAITAHQMLYAHWTANKYDVTLDYGYSVDGASDVNTTQVIEVTYDSAYGAYTGNESGKLPELSRVGYVFDGWYDTPQTVTGATATQITDTTQVKVADDDTLYAYWTAIVYTVNVNVAEGTLTDATWIPTNEADVFYKTFTITDTAFALPGEQELTRTGYTFKGWDRNASLTEVTPSELIPSLWEVSPENTSVTYTAAWDINSYTVTYDSNGGNTVEAVKQEYNSAVSEPAEPTKTGYTFAGWFTGLGTDDETQYFTVENPTFNMPVGGITLTAKWTPNLYDVVISVDDKSVVFENIPFGTPLDDGFNVVGAPTKTGYTFAGWFTETNGQGLEAFVADSSVTVPVDGITIYAHFTPNQYRIQLDYGYKASASDASNIAGEVVVTYDQTYSYGTTGNNGLQNLTRTGYSFDGWYTALENGTKVELNDVVVLTDTTAIPTKLYAKWTATDYKISYTGIDNVTNASDLPNGYDADKLPLTLTTPVKTGYTFDGWTVPGMDGAQDTYTIPVGTTGDITVGANWEVITYNIEYVYDENVAMPSDIPTSYTIEQEVALPEPTKTGYTFDGWNETSASEAIREFPVGTHGNKELTAAWTANTYQIALDYGYKENSSDVNNKSETISVIYDQAYSVGMNGTNGLPIPSRDGYTFGGWYTEANGGILIPVASKVEITSAVTAIPTKLYAHWTPITYHLTLDMAEGNFVDVTAAENAGWELAEGAYRKSFTIESEAIELPTLSKTGYTYKGWSGTNVVSDTSDGDSVYYYLKAGVFGDQLATAQWQINQYTVTYVTGTGETVSSVTQDYNEVLTVPENPDRTGYTFNGWDTTVPTTTPAENVTITATWTANKYDVTLDYGYSVDGASDVNTTQVIEVTYDSTYGAYKDNESGKLPELSRVGYVFDGWYDAPQTVARTTATQITDTTQVKVADDDTLYAHWTAIVYTVNVNLAGGTLADTTWIAASEPDVFYKTFTITDTAFALPGEQELTRTGYTFKGWDRNASLTEVAPSELIPSLWEVSPENTSVTYTAAWDINSYTVTYDSNGGNTVEAVTQEYNSAVSEPAEPTKTGYTFAGWFTGLGTDDETQYFTAENPTFNMPVDGITLTAKWIPNKYDVVISCDGNVITLQNIDYGTKLNADFNIVGTPAKTGYTFNGWFTKVNGEGERVFTQDCKVTVPVDGITIYGYFEPNAYQITFDKNGADGTETMVAVGAVYDQNVTIPQNVFTRTGYHFVNWNTATDGSGTTFEVGTTATAPNLATGTGTDTTATLYAQWNANEYTVVFNANGGVGEDVSQSFTYDHAQSLRPNSFTREGYLFAGWAETATATTAKYTETVDGTNIVTASVKNLITGADGDESITLYAVWAPIDYTITFDSNGGSDVDSITQGYTSIVTKPADPTRTGYEFNGWFTGLGTDDEVKCFDNAEQTMVMPLNGVTLTAKWTPINYTLTFDSNGGSDVASITQGYETIVSRPTDPTKEGYTFAGWYANLGSVSETRYFTTDTMSMPLDGLVLSAKWTPNTYVVTYDLNYEGAPAVSETTSATYDQAYTSLLEEPSREGYKFIGWYDAKTDGNKIVTDVSIHTVSSDVELYAQWEIQSYTIKLILNDTLTGTRQNYNFVEDSNWVTSTVNGSYQANYTAEYKTIIPTPAIPTRTGYDFVGWYKTSAFTEGTEIALDGTTTIPGSNTTLYAKWALKDCVIRFENVDDCISYPSDIEKKYGEAFAAPADPVKTGYTFDGWYTTSNYASGTKYVFKDSNIMPESITLYAKWTINSYNVNFVDLDNSILTGISYRDEYNSVVTMPEDTYQPTQTGYIFSHWSLTSGGEAIDEETEIRIPADDLNIYAVYISYLDLLKAVDSTDGNIDFASDVDGKSELDIAREYYMLLNDAQKAEYEGTTHQIALWAKIKEVSEQKLRQSVVDAQPITNDILSKVEATNSNNEAVIIDLAEMKVFDENLKANPPVIEGMIKEDQYAAINMLNVEFMTALFTYDEIVSIVCDNDQNPDVNPKEHVLTGKTIATDGTLASDQFNIMLIMSWAALDPNASQDAFLTYLQENMNTLKIEALDGTSLWMTAKAETQEGVTYDVTYRVDFYSETHNLTYTDAGDNAEDYAANAKYETVVTLPTPVKRGYTFTGWTTDNQDITLTNTEGVYSFTMGRTDVSLAAHWEVQPYTVSLDMGDGSLIGALDGTWATDAETTMRTQGYTVETEELTLPTGNQVVAPTGYTFGGWYLQGADASNPDNVSGSVVLNPKTDEELVLQNYTYVAKWIPIEYAMTVYLVDGSLAEGAQLPDGWNAGVSSTNSYVRTFTVESTDIVLPTVERYGYEFAGWYTTDTYADGTQFTLQAGETLAAGNVNLYAKWTPKQISVTLYRNDETTDYTTTTVTFGTTFGNLPTPAERDGYGFDGWFTEAENGTKYDANVSVTSTDPVTLYAHWTAGSFNINYEGLDFAGVDDATNHADNPSSYVVDTEVELKAPTRTGYTFAGWTGDNVETVTTQDGTKYYLKDGITGNQTVTATWTINQYTLTFIDPMDNDNVLYTIKQDYRSAVTTPPIPTKEGYTFVSWDKTVPSTMPAESIVYKASWAINSHSITFIDYNGNTQAVDTYDFGDTMTVRTAAAVEGYRFVGWFATEGTEKVQYFADAANPETMPDHDIVVRAEYQINQYTFTFDTDTEGQVVIDAVTKDFGATVTAPTEPTKIGHTFAGWYNVDTTDTKEYFAKDDAGHAQAEIVPAKNISLKAKWTVNSYTITFVDPMDVDPEGNGKVLYTITNKYGEALTMPAAPTKAGYLFAGWDGTFPSTMPAENLTLNATWNAIQYSVTFNGNGATAESVPADMTNLSYNVTYSLPTEVPVRTGYTFAGWKTAGGEAALGDITNLSTSNNAKVTLYAMWTANTYTVTLDANGGTLDQATMVVTYDKKYEGLPTPVRTGYSFNGWFDGTTNITADTDVKITQNQTLVAQWTEKGDTPYTVVHYLQDLEGISYTKDKEVSYTGKTNATATATAESYTGYALNTVKSSLTGTIAADGSLVLVAYYDRIPYTVTWNVANTTVQETYPFGATPDYTGEKDYADDHASYTFTGWDKAISAVTGDVTYTAQYESSYEASIGEVTYATLEKALSMAVAGETVYLEKDVTLTSDITVPTGVDLLIPCMDDDFGYQYVDDGKLRFNHDGTDLSGVQGLGPNAYMYRRLTVPEGVTVTINGNILINSVSGRPSGGNYEMDITGGYAQIDLAGDIVVADGGNLDCYGYVKGNGTVRAKSGSSVGDLYVVRNWRGGSQALEMYQSFITYGTEDERQTYPMNEYDCHNIETDIIIEHGASYDGNVKMNANAGEGNAYYYTRFPQVNVNNGLIRLTDEDGYVVRSYDATTGIETFTLYGGADFAESSLTIMGRDLSTKDFVYPIDGDIGFVLKDGDYHFKNDWKFLTGEGMTVCNGATLNVDYRTYVAFYDEFDDVDNSGNTEYPDRQAAILRIEEGAKFINGGTFGGSIVTESPDILIGDYPTWGITTLEANGYCNGVVRLEHPLNITREGYSWRYGDPELGEVENSIIWYGADYTALIAAVKSVPKDLDIYSDATADPLEAVLDAIVYDLGKDKQAQVDTWTEQVTQYVAALELRVVNVVLDPAGGTVSPASIQITYGGTYAELPTPTYYGYNFLGWFDADNVQIQATDTMKLTVNETTLTAHWEKIPADYSKVNEAINAIPADMTGYTESSVQAVYDAEDAVDMTLGLAEQAKVDAMAQAILDAIDALEYVQITVSFDANGGVAITDTFTLRYKDAYPYDSLPVPVRDGYDFVGWYTAKEGGTQIKADTYVTSVEDVTLYAKWTDSSSNEPADYSAVTAAIAKIPADATPYTAASWNKLEEAKNAVVYDLTVDRQDDVNAWAKAIEDAITALEYKTITVYFDPVDGTCATGNIKVTYGTAPGSLPEATRTYYEFLGWYTDKTGGDKVTGAYLATKTENVTVYAQYQILPADYSQIEALKAQIPGDLSCYSDETVAALNTALAQIETGYTADKQTIVDRWATELQTALDNLTYRSMTLTYEPQGGRVTPKTLTVTYGDVLAEMPTPDRSNHVFDGWYTEAVGGTKVEAGYKITHVEDFSLYAHWIQVDADYSEIYEEIEKIPEDVEVYYTEASVANLQAALDAVVYGLDAGHQSQINQWASDINVARLKLQGKSVKVTFSYNGGTTDTSYKNVRYSNTYGTLPTTTKSGYEFEGWYTAKTGGTLVTSSTKMMQITNHTLYAHWKSTAVEPPVVEPPVVTPPAVVGPTCTKDHIDPNCSSRHFADIDQTTAWYHLNVDYVVANGIMNGIAVAPGQAAQFAPDLTTTRGMIVTILYRMSGDTVTAVEKAACPFVDVPDGIYYEDAVAWAYANGVVQGISNDLFAPENEITREQMILMLHRFAGYLGEDTSAYKSVSSFVDAGSVSSWSSQAVAWGYAEGLLTGIPDANGQLQITPQGAIPRCQAAAFIHRFCEKFK